MSPSARLGTVVLAAAAVGAGAGYLARPGPSALARPAAVETLLRAVDHADADAIERALAVAGPAAGYASPWREEVEMAGLVSSGDADALWRFATTPPAGAARARALLWLRTRGATPAERERAAERLRADYPRSWASAPAAARASGGSR